MPHFFSSIENAGASQDLSFFNGKSSASVSGINWLLIFLMNWLLESFFGGLNLSGLSLIFIAGLITLLKSEDPSACQP